MYVFLFLTYFMSEVNDTMKDSSVHQQIKWIKMWYIYTVEYYSAINRIPTF